MTVTNAIVADTKVTNAAVTNGTTTNSEEVVVAEEEAVVEEEAVITTKGLETECEYVEELVMRAAIRCSVKQCGPKSQNHLLGNRNAPRLHGRS